MHHTENQTQAAAGHGLLMRLVRNMAIRHKLMAVIMVTCIVALTLAAIVFISYHYMDARHQMVQKLKTQTKMIGYNCQAALVFDAPKDAEEILGALHVEPSIVHAYIYNQEGRLFSKYRREGTAFAMPPLATDLQNEVCFAGNHLCVSQPVFDEEGSEQLGTVAVWSDLSHLQQMFFRNLLISLGIMFVALLAAFLISSRIQGVISKPILSLADIARTVSDQQEYTIRATKHTNDEVGFLIDAFNEMLEQIQERDLALVGANEKLEARVKERTAKLSQANEQLKAEIGHRNRAEQTLRERTERTIRHQAALLKLGNLAESDLSTLLRATAEEVARTLVVERVGIWEIDEDQTKLTCQDQFILSKNTHEEGAVLLLQDIPKYYQALEASRIVAADEACKDPRTRELTESHLKPHGVTAMMDVPIRLHGKLMAVLCLEHTGTSRQWSLEEQDFAGSVVDMIMLNMERQERQKARIALRESEHRYRTLLKNIPQKIFYKDLHSTYLLCNESYAEDLGLALPDDICGKTDFDFHPDHLAKQYVEGDRRIMENGEPEEIEEIYLHGDQELTIRTLKSPVRGEDGRVIGIFGIFWDITARKEAEEALATLNRDLENTVQELRRSNRELQDFAYVTAHDLKAPLRAIGTLTDWIYTDNQDKFDDQGREQMLLVKGRVTRMNELIDSILRYSEIGRGTRSLQKVNLDALVSEVIAMVDPPESMEVQVEGPLPLVTCEKVRLVQVFQNLISNAIKYMNKPQGVVRIRCIEQDGLWQFCVSDNGPGIDEKYFEKIFKMFQTLTPRDELESTGIGLAVVKKIIELYGGKVWVESTPDEGCAFYFTLPKSMQAQESIEAVGVTSAT